MSLNASCTARRLASQSLRGCRSPQSGITSSLRPLVSTSSFSTSPSRSQEYAAAVPPPEDDAPRWARTPERMKAPFSQHITKNPKNSVWSVNTDPAKLDDALNNLLGKGGERLLPDELKWLAVTHKSFDQGRRGFNDRLAYLGRQIALTEAMQSILSETAGPLGEQTMDKDPFEGRREPFENAMLEKADRLTFQLPNSIFNLKNMQKLAVETGISEVVRWKPRQTESLRASGISVVMSGALYAIVGAVALQHGGKAASRVVRERILKKLRV
ncbi:putative Ribonuclease-III-like-domain-containing protein [Seiridium cardinale]